LKNQKRSYASVTALVLALAMSMPSMGTAQETKMQDRVAELKLATTVNKQALAQYSWQEQQTISIKGEVKKEDLYQVHLGPDGNPQKTDLDPQQQSSGGRQHGIKHRVKEKKTEEYEEYGKQIGSLAQSYAKPDPDRIQQAYQHGNVLVGPLGTPNEVRLVIQNYLKQGDSLTFVLDRARKVVQSIQVSSYLNDPKDAVTISAQFAQLPDGTNHVSSMVVNGVSKQLTVNTQNSNYQKV
jgi:hypothetical protein